jgi:hypothetical protein
LDEKSKRKTARNKVYTENTAVKRRKNTEVHTADKRKGKNI